MHKYTDIIAYIIGCFNVFFSILYNAARNEDENFFYNAPYNLYRPMRKKTNIQKLCIISLQTKKVILLLLYGRLVENQVLARRSGSYGHSRKYEVTKTGKMKTSFIMRRAESQHTKPSHHFCTRF
jgi:hypothetical protein